MAILRGLLTHMCTNVYTHTHTHTHTHNWENCYFTLDSKVCVYLQLYFHAWFCHLD
jgi:hypothetical protein